MSEINRMDIGEFRELGFLQEANRLFFHPHGLALEITVVTGEGESATREKILEVAKDYSINASPRYPAISLEGLADAITEALYPVGSVRLSGIWDYREDPEGILFAEKPDREKADRVLEERKRHMRARNILLHRGIGEVEDVQPVDWAPEA